MNERTWYSSLGGRLARVSLGIGLLAMAWQLVAWSTDSMAIPDVPDFIRYGPRALRALITRHIEPTLLRLLAAYVVGTAAGISVGVLLHTAGRFLRGAAGWVDLFRSIPGTIMYPFFLPFAHLGETIVCLPSAWVVFWLAVFTTYRELVGAFSERLRYLQAHRARRAFVYWHLHRFALARSVFGNVRVSVSLSLAVLVAMEMWAGPNTGIGYYARIEQEDSHYVEMLVAILVTGILGLAANGIIKTVERRALWWESRED
jgi:ABC-type nitrate/sulfonate/bicarbonate transport system permease component